MRPITIARIWGFLCGVLMLASVGFAISGPMSVAIYLMLWVIVLFVVASYLDLGNRS